MDGEKQDNEISLEQPQSIRKRKFLMNYATKRLLFFIVILNGLFQGQIEGSPPQELRQNPSRYLSQEVFDEVQNYLIPEKHPIKKKLDKIFSRIRVISDLKTMKAAGFKFLQSENRLKIIVAKHPKIPGYIIKAYLDENPKGKPEYFCLTRRIRGARAVQASIEKHNCKNLFKTTIKWLYLVPDDPEPRKGHNRKMFIIVEKELDIVHEKKNERLWRSPRVSQELLFALYTIMNEVGLGDIKPRNCPFCRDGRIAFIDTGSCETTPKHQKLLPYLSFSMQTYWSDLNSIK